MFIVSMCSIPYGDGIPTEVKAYSVFVLMNIGLIIKIHTYPMIRARNLNYRSKNLHAIWIIDCGRKSDLKIGKTPF